MQEKDLDLKSLDDKLPASLKGIFYDEPLRQYSEKEIEQGKKAIADFIENNKNNKTK